MTVDGATDVPAARRAGSHRLRNGLIFGGVALVLLAALYLLVGYYYVPRLLRQTADHWAQDTLHKPIRIGQIRFDPLRFTLDVQDIAVPQAQPMVAADRIHVGFSFLSLLHGPYTFSEVRLERPVVNAVIRPDHSLNLGDLAPKSKAPAKSGGRAVRIGTFTIVAGQATYTDQSLAGSPRTALSPVTFTLKDFQTDASAGGAFTLHGRSELGEGLAWSGNLSTAPLHSHGRLQVSALRARTIGAFLGSSAPAAPQDGQLDFTTAYDLRSAQEGLKLDLTDAEFDASGLKAKGLSGLPASTTAGVDHAHARLDRFALALGGHDGPDFQASLPSATLDGLSLDAPGQPVRIGSVALSDVSLDSAARRLNAGGLTVDGAKLRVRRAPDGRLSLAALTPKPPAAPAPAAQTKAMPWSVHLASFALRRAALEFDDATVTPATHLVASPIDLEASDLDSDTSQPVKIRLDARAEGARFQLSGSAIPAKGSGDFKLSLVGLPLKTIQPYAPRLHDADLTSGEVSASGQLKIGGAKADPITFSGQAAIDKFSVRQPSTNGVLVAWDAFRLEGLRYGARGASVERGVLVAPIARVVVMPDRTLNLAAVTTTAEPTAQPVADAPVVAAPSPTGTVSPTAAVSPIVGPSPARTTAPTTPPVSHPAVSRAAGSSSEALPFVLKRLDVSGGTMDFADLSIDPNFQARIEALGGSLTNISSRPGAITDIDLTGHVIDRFSPVAIKGSMDVTAFDRQTDIHLSFRNIELPLFNPYSGRYAGYAIAKGKLTTELSYKIDHRQLKAEHHVVIDQLQWGAATNSKQKAPVPVRLATALLKDKNGVINLDVPVSGSMDDPKFKVWPIIWQIVRTTIEKAAVAPFRLIGGLFAGSEKAQYVDFEPGSASLPTEASQSLGALGKALADRPVLSVDIPAGPGLAEDANALADQRIDQALLAQKSKPSAAPLSPDERFDRMKALYKAKFHQNPAFPPPTAQAKLTPASDGQAAAPPSKLSGEQRKAQDLAWLEDRLRPAYAPTTAELQALGEARARDVRDALLAQGSSVDPKQVFMTPQANPIAENGKTRLTLKLQ